MRCFSPPESTSFQSLIESHPFDSLAVNFVKKTLSRITCKSCKTKKRAQKFIRLGKRCINYRKKQKIVNKKTKKDAYLISNALFLLNCGSVGVNNLISERTVWQVGSLRNVEDFVTAGLVDLTTSGRPQLAQDSKKGTFAAPIRSCDHHVHARVNLEAHLGD